MAEFFEHALAGQEVDHVVLDQQDAQGSAGGGRGLGRRLPFGPRAGQAQGQGQEKRRAPALLGVDVEARIHEPRQPAHDGKSKPRPLETAGVGALGLDEGLEDFVQLVVGDADARVRDGNEHARAAFFPFEQRRLHPHRALFRELDGVADEVEEDLAQPDFVADERGRQARVHLERQRKALFPGGHGREVEDRGAQSRQGEFGLVDDELAGLDAGEVQDVG
ncbi:hypothetical protein DSECCO2_609520 [anaerobic digester metagenome]